MCMNYHQPRTNQLSSIVLVSIIEDVYNELKKIIEQKENIHIAFIFSLEKFLLKGRIKKKKKLLTLTLSL